MSNTYYTSLTGMLAASYGLQNTSNNIASMQRPGFKRSEVFYSSLGNSTSEDGLGSGVCIDGTSTNFSAGKFLNSDNPADLAISGQGFFIIRLKNNELLYTRDGEFTFNNEGFLVDRHSGGLVQGHNQQGHLVPIQQFGPKNNNGKSSHFIDLAGEFILIEKKKEDSPIPNPDPTPGLTKSKYETIHFTLASIFDEKGKEHQIYLEFEPMPPITNQDMFDGLEWNLLKVTCDDKDIPFIPQSLKFSSQSDGSLEDGNNIINLKLNNGQSIALKFGSYMSDKDKAVHLKKQDIDSASTKITLYKQDGYGEGKQISFSFDDNGQISYNYDNGQSIQGIHVALAKFMDLEQVLTPAHDNLFRAKTEHGRQIGRANKEGFGSIQPQTLESSNVDSTTEFANIVVLQRMFQACSQIMDIDKQLLEELVRK